MSKEPLRRMLYISSVSAPMGEQQLFELLEEMCHESERFGVTGLLLYGGDYFMHVMEGAPEDVGQMTDEIERNIYHEPILKLYDNPQVGDNRHYPDWQMAFQREDTSEAAPRCFSTLIEEDASGNASEMIRTMPDISFVEELVLAFGRAAQSRAGMTAEDMQGLMPA